MSDGPGPPGTVLVTVCPVLASVARIFSGLSGISGSFETQRILLPRSGSCGLRSASLTPQRIATMLPWAPITWGIGRPGGWNPARAQTGSGVNGSAGEQLPPAPLSAAPPT